MAFFIKNLFKRRNKMTTLEQIQKAYDDLSEDDKKKFHQSLKDRIDESVGEQEHDDGNKDSQSAKDRVDESLGEEKALEEKREEKDVEMSENKEETPHSEGAAEYEMTGKTSSDMPEWAKGLLDRLGKIESYFDGKANGVEEAAEEIYGIGNGVFQGDDKAPETKRMSGAEVKAILNKIKR